MKTRAAELEEILNNVKVHPKVSVGELLSTLLFLKLQCGSFSWVDIFAAIKIILLPNPKKINFYEWHHKKKSKELILIGLSSFSTRLTGFFIELVKNNIFWNFDATLPGNDCSLKIKSTHNLKGTYLPFSIVKEIVFSKGVSMFEKIVILSLTQIQWIKFKFFLKLLNENPYKAVLTDFDRYTCNAPIILAARCLSIPNATIVHGAINPIGHYLPVLADQIWVWGKDHEEQFSSYSKKGISIIIIGNPKVLKYKRRIVKNFQNLGIAMTAPPHPERNKFLKLILGATNGVEKFYIKLHPLDNNGPLLKSFLNDNITILDVKTSIDEFIDSIDLLCVRRSQIGSDALCYDIPIIICDGIQDGDLQNGQVLNEKAGCPIVNDAESLQKEIYKLKSDKTYLETRLKKQKDYYYNLYSYVGSDSVVQMNSALKNLITHYGKF